MSTAKNLRVITPKKSPKSRKSRKNHDFHSDYVPNLMETRHEELVNEVRHTRKHLRQEAIMLRKTALWTMIISVISMALWVYFASYAREALGTLCMIALGAVGVLCVLGAMVVAGVVAIPQSPVNQNVQQFNSGNSNQHTQNQRPPTNQNGQQFNGVNNNPPPQNRRPSANQNGQQFKGSNNRPPQNQQPSANQNGQQFNSGNNRSPQNQQPSANQNGQQFNSGNNNRPPQNQRSSRDQGHPQSNVGRNNQPNPQNSGTSPDSNQPAISAQIARIDGAGKLVEFTDGLVVPLESDYGHVHGIGGSKHARNSTIGIRICDYTNGTGPPL